MNTKNERMGRIVMDPTRPTDWQHVLRAGLLCAGLALTGWVSGCAPLSPESRWQRADALATQARWHPQRIVTAPFVLRAYVPQPRVRADTLTVYIEGDGLAWLSPTEISADPTPRTPVALQMALRHPDAAVAYLARPCQYVAAADAQHCDPRFWTSARFAPEVIQATDQALTTLMQDVGARQLVLVGYSGGGAVAALVAARRKDVVRLVTVAGNLDHAAWTQWHKVTPLSGSLNPADEWEGLREVPQIHLAGARDTVVPPPLAQAYVDRYPAGQQPQLRVLPGQDHSCCWTNAWPVLAAQVLPPPD